MQTARTKIATATAALIVAAIATLAMLLITPMAARAASTFKIGLSLPVAGNAAILASQFRQGAQLALNLLAPDGEIELVVADDGCDPDLARLAAQDLRSAGVSIITGFLCNDAARAAADELRPDAIPLILAGARSEQLMKDAQEEDWNLWRIAPGDDAVARAAFEFLSPRWNNVPWAVVDDGTVYGRTLADDFRALMEEGGNPPQFVDNFRPAQSTQAGMIRRLRSAGVSAAFLAASAEDAAIISSNLADSGSPIEVAGADALSLLPLVQTEETVRDGLLAILQPEPLDLPSARVLTSQLARNDIDPEPYVYLGYAAVEVAMAALRADTAETTRALGETVFQTVLGAVDFDAEGRNTAPAYRLYQWQDGQFVALDASPR